MHQMVSVLRIHPIQGNSHIQMSQSFIIFTQVFCNILFKKLYCLLDIDELISLAHMPLGSYVHLSFVPKYMSECSTELDFNGIYHFNLFNILSGNDGCKRCHSHNIRCKSNTLTYVIADTNPSSTGQGWHHRTDTPIPTYVLQDML